MSAIKVTKQQRANAIEALTVMWPSVPEANVIKELCDWRLDDYGQPTCGTVACFGGWTECWPPFREQKHAGNCWEFFGWEVWASIYGDPRDLAIDGLFYPRRHHPADVGFTGTDHQLVTNRLKWLLENSEVAA